MYCLHCGTELPDSSNYCYACGTKIILDEIVSNEEVLNFERLAKMGTVTSDDISHATAVYELARSDSDSAPNNSILFYYSLARKINTFFFTRWYMSGLKLKLEPKRIDRKTLREEWRFFASGGLSSIAFLVNTDEKLRDLEKQINYLIYHYKGLAIWLEDSILVHLLLTFERDRIKPSEVELSNLSKTIGEQRLKKIVDDTFLDDPKLVPWLKNIKDSLHKKKSKDGEPSA